MDGAGGGVVVVVEAGGGGAHRGVPGAGQWVGMGVWWCVCVWVCGCQASKSWMTVLALCRWSCWAAEHHPALHLPRPLPKPAPAPLPTSAAGNPHNHRLASIGSGTMLQMMLVDNLIHRWGVCWGLGCCGAGIGAGAGALVLAVWCWRWRCSASDGAGAGAGCPAARCGRTAEPFAPGKASDASAPVPDAAACPAPLPPCAATCTRATSWSGSSRRQACWVSGLCSCSLAEQLPAASAILLCALPSQPAHLMHQCGRLPSIQPASQALT
jgi:hypothetical protein